MEFSPDGKRMLVSFQSPKTMLQVSRIYDLEAHSQICELETPPALATIWGMRSRGGFFHHFTWSGDGTSILGNSQTRIAVWNSMSGLVTTAWDRASGLATAAYKYPPKSKLWIRDAVRYSPDGKTLVDSGVPSHRFDRATGQLLSKPESRVQWRPYSTVNAELGFGTAFNSKNHRVQAIDSKTNKAITRFQSTRFFQVIDHTTRKVVWEAPIPRHGSNKWGGNILGVVDDGERIVPARERLLLWDGKTRRQLLSPPIQPDTHIRDFAFSPDNRRLAYLDYDEYNPLRPLKTRFQGELVVWDYGANRIVWRKATTEYHTGLQWSPDGKWLSMSVFNNSTPTRIQVFDQSGELRYERENAARLCWSSDSKQLAINVIGVRDTAKIIFSSYLEIHRFDD